jgi:hypothetical protein
MRVGDNSGNYSVVSPVVQLSASGTGAIIRVPSAAVPAVNGSSIAIFAGNGLSGARGGSIVSTAGNGDIEGGTVGNQAGTGTVLGGVAGIYSGAGGQFGGNVDIVAASGPVQSGNINLTNVPSLGGIAGSINLTPGDGTSNQGFINVVPYTTGPGVTSKLVFLDTSGVQTNHIGFRAPDVVTTPVVWTLPAADGTVGSTLTTNGVGGLQWTPPANPVNVAGTKIVPLQFDGIAQFDPLNFTNTVLFLESNGGLVTHTGLPFLAANITVGSTVTIIGCSDINIFSIPSTPPQMSLNGNITLWNDTAVTLMWVGTGWLEMSRNT